MYVMIVWSRWSNEDIDAVLGPFTWEEVLAKYHKLFGNEYRHVSMRKIDKELPEWAK